MEFIFSKKRMNELLEKHEGLHAIDLFFAQKVVPDACNDALLILAYLLKSAREGHLCMFLDLPQNCWVAENLSKLPKNIFGEYLILNENRLYLRRNWECENRFLHHFERLKFQKPTFSVDLKDISQEPLNEQQKKAIIKAASQIITLFSGSPGTGKTHTACVLIRKFFEMGIREIAIAAPTGKAVANMRFALGKIAEKCTLKTLHSLLSRKNLYADLVLIDEASMVDAEMMAALFGAIKDGARLVLLGDKDQLPPIESGHFFSDLAQDPDCVAELTTCLRTEIMEIVNLATKVKRGETIPYRPLPELKKLIHEMAECNVKILTPLKRGLYGVDSLNRLLYEEFKKRGEIKIPVMITVNDFSRGLYNGDIGILDLNEQKAYFSENRVFPENALPRYEYAYALSVHKSQGSEYEKVVVLLPEGSEIFGRQMLYTAITRAKKSLEVLAHEGVIEKLVANQPQRNSGIFSSCHFRGNSAQNFTF
jgi:exodeoxyribonuclease V alpha subunit